MKKNSAEEITRCGDCVHYTCTTVFPGKKRTVGRCSSQDVWDAIRAPLSVIESIEYIQVSSADYCSNAESKND